MEKENEISASAIDCFLSLSSSPRNYNPTTKTIVSSSHVLCAVRLIDARFNAPSTFSILSYSCIL